MEVYSCTVRLAGSHLNEVTRINVTAPEVILLAFIHGGDAIANLKHIGKQKADHAAERDRLSALYGDKKVAELFGAAHRELPLKVPSNLMKVTTDDVAPVAEAAGAALLA